MTLEYTDAAYRVGVAKFGNDYISELTYFEAWLLWNAGITSNPPKWREGLGIDDEPPADVAPSLIAAAEQYPETRAALYKWQFMQWQRDEVLKWLRHRGIEVTDQSIFGTVDKEAFEKAFSLHFPLSRLTAPARASSDLDALRIERDGPERQGGRPRKWDWDGAMVELIRLANTPDGLPQVQADVERHLTDWFTVKFGDHPAESKIREKVSAVMRALARPETRRIR